MRSADTYRAAKRAAKKKRMRGQFDLLSPQQRTQALKLLHERQDEQRRRMEEWRLSALKNDIIDGLTVEQVDKALEATLDKHWARGASAPLELGRMFAARARALHWQEGVEFVEKRDA